MSGEGFPLFKNSKMDFCWKISGSQLKNLRLFELCLLVFPIQINKKPSTKNFSGISQLKYFEFFHSP